MALLACPHHGSVAVVVCFADIIGRTHFEEPSAYRKVTLHA
eukprot:CAMPEP_0185747190 /NCGR_PEP_ID=MMETSP1174-20130828/5820_1 /TAXON_ID=35687 /ORGANISM="Dictyocha speculum, Strain CCMP1381" /LENGTH=40 /DNA_ID= /DNA_START= /DNA_END= /DNA_ORIENTATION=